MATQYVWKRCPECIGGGWYDYLDGDTSTRDGKRCETCGGHGRIQVDDEPSDDGDET